jgi:hypothetical protein
MPGGGIIWGTIISVPLWLVVILFVKAGGIAMETLIFVGLILSGLLLFIFRTSPQNTKQDEQDTQLFSTTTKVRPFYKMKMALKMADNGGTRLGIDRRKFEYTAYAPERRSGKNRREGLYPSELTRYEARSIGEHEWHKISEKTTMERLVDSFDPVNPIISRMLEGEEIIVSHEICRVLSR